MHVLFTQWHRACVWQEILYMLYTKLAYKPSLNMQFMNVYIKTKEIAFPVFKHICFREDMGRTTWEASTKKAEK